LKIIENIYNYFSRTDPALIAKIDQISADLKTANQKLEKLLMAEPILQELLAKVRRNNDRTDSALLLLHGINAKLKELIASGMSRAEVIDAITQVTAELDAQDAEVRAAIEANTEPEPTPEPTEPTEEEEPVEPFAPHEDPEE
jgi:hypothetical protein